MPDDDGKIRITLDDLQDVKLPVRDPGIPESYGRVPDPAETPVSLSTTKEPAQSGRGVERALRASKALIFRKTWFYLGCAGLLGSLLGWAICEPGFVDGPGRRDSWANFILVPLIVALICVGLGVAEAVVEHSPRRAVTRGGLSILLGAVLGWFFYSIANIVFAIEVSLLVRSGIASDASPLFWVARAVAWMGFGISGGIVYGIVGQSAKKCAFGILGGLIGAGLGGVLFDPIARAVHGGGFSRAVGFALFGAATGIAIGLVESALKDRWLYVAAGPLAGKQFVLYKTLTTMGSSEACDLYLFKDPSIAPQHATLELRGPRVFLRATGQMTVNGRPARDMMLSSGDYLQVGRYGFHYRDRERAGG